jgi:hypothetical protein
LDRLPNPCNFSPPTEPLREASHVILRHGYLSNV